MSMNENEVLWGAATMIMKQYGDGAPRHVADRIGALVLAGDVDGIRVWKAIARRIDQMTHPEGAVGN